MLVKSGLSVLALCVGLFAVVANASAVSLQQLRSTPDLDPQKFAAYFADFDFTFRAKVQPPEIFLASKDGDCDDYATLAAEILAERGFTPRLIAIRMPRVVHVVCYIEETGAFLDFNARSAPEQTISCDNTIEAVAQAVAKSYGTRWNTASEFTFENGLKRLVATVQRNKETNFAGLNR